MSAIVTHDATASKVAEPDVGGLALPGPPLPGEVVGEDEHHLGHEHQPLGEPRPEEDADQAADGIRVDERRPRARCPPP